jgi:hypothetical protein
VRNRRRRRPRSVDRGIARLGIEPRNGIPDADDVQSSEGTKESELPYNADSAQNCDADYQLPQVVIFYPTDSPSISPLRSIILPEAIQGVGKPVNLIAHVQADEGEAGPLLQRCGRGVAASPSAGGRYSAPSLTLTSTGVLENTQSHQWRMVHAAA